MKKTAIRLSAKDNVAIAVEDIARGSAVMPGVTAREDIPQGHKVALDDIEKGGAVIRYGVALGCANKAIPMGGWVNEDALALPTPPGLSEMAWGRRIAAQLPQAPRTTFEGYVNPRGGPAGTRNILGISTTVQCVAGVLNIAVERIRKELLPRFPHVDDVVALTHDYGCGVAIDAPDADIPIRTLRNLALHPNFGGQVMVIGLGCEKLTLDRLLDKEDNRLENVLMLQDLHGMEDMLRAILAMSENKLRRLDQRRRVTLPLSDLVIGLQCGGSDAFSGVTANPAAGYAADMLVQAGGTALFSEASEVRDGAHLMAERCVDEATCRKLARELQWFDDYLARGGADRSANPAPGNKKGGLSNIVEKAMGSIAKSGTAPIVEVLAPAERPTRKGMIYANTAASDFVCGTSQLASGMGLQVFMTGRGTPYGLAAAPVIKVCTRNDLKARWGDLIDINAGPIATGEKTVQQVGTELFHAIVDVASGLRQPAAERYRIHNDLCLFNPTPVT